MIKRWLDTWRNLLPSWWPEFLSLVTWIWSTMPHMVEEESQFLQHICVLTHSCTYTYTFRHQENQKLKNTFSLFKGSEIGSGRYMGSGSVRTKHIFFYLIYTSSKAGTSLFINSSVYICIFVVLGIQPRVSHMLGQCSTTEFHAKCLFWMF